MRGGDPEQLQQFGAVAALFPACAGVIPVRFESSKSEGTFPRMRGGDPRGDETNLKYRLFSPHARG